MTVGEVVATRASGRWVDGNAEFDIVADGVTLSYRAVPPSAWVRRGGADWVAVDGGTLVADPLAALRAPIRIDFGADRDAGTDLIATYPAAALGLEGTGEVTVTVTIGPDGRVEAAYRVVTSGGPAVSRTVFRPADDTSPIPPAG